MKVIILFNKLMNFKNNKIKKMIIFKTKMLIKKLYKNKLIKLYN